MLTNEKFMLERRQPTKKQLALAARLGIQNAEMLSRKELALTIEQVLKEKAMEEEKKYENTVEEMYPETPVEEYPGYTNIENPIEIQIDLKENQQTLNLLKRKKLYANSPYLLHEFLSFLRTVGAKRKGNKITLRSKGVFSPAYLRTVLDSFFISYNWRYAE
ncbi:hypothetical protein [Persephonella sp.]